MNKSNWAKDAKSSYNERETVTRMHRCCMFDRWYLNHRIDRRNPAHRHTYMHISETRRIMMIFTVSSLISVGPVMHARVGVIETSIYKSVPKDCWTFFIRNISNRIIGTSAETWMLIERRRDHSIMDALYWHFPRNSRKYYNHPYIVQILHR